MKIARACLFIDDFNKPSEDLIGRVAASAASAGILLGPAGCCAASLADSGFQDCDSCDAGLVLGGDGTILRGFGYFMERGIPSFGINTGHLGYLASAELDETDSAMTALAAGDSILERLPVLRAAMPGGEVLTAVNDISINRSISGGLLHLDVRTHDETIASVAGDGIVVSTPLGSTAYAMSAGGPILDPGIPAILMVALCAHQISLRPIVFSAGTALALGVGQVRGEGPVVCADGRPCGILQQGETVIVTYHDGCCPVLRMRTGDGFYARLGRKFGWGARG